MTTLADFIDELLVLWPALPTALARDAGIQTGERVTTSENVHTVPLNVDVAAVLVDLHREIPDWARWAAETAGETPTASGGIPGHLRRIQALHDRLSGLGRTRDAERLATTVHAWLTACRRALGLNRPDRPFGEHCPRHDQPLTALVLPGDHGHLRYTRTDRHGHPIDAHIVWSRIEIVCCRHCDAMWTPERYMLLGRLIRQANRDREHQAAEETGDAA
ncbi:hypothetical protein [Actinoplanes sp. NPDC049118]|uniref:hypothetical protein n=1 Tax=Actinoplanes sp. NPDC049118 TaxID=3155769 RepID=UPI0033DA1DC2